MRLIHCSDLHLDSKMDSYLSLKQARERNNEIFIIFENMIKYAKDMQVKAIIIAGDMFDTKRVSTGTVKKVYDAMSAAADIEFLYLAGNHDEQAKAIEDIIKPDNLFCFSDEWNYYDYEDVTISGIVQNKDNYVNLYANLQLDKNRTNIVVMHGQTATTPGEGMITLNRLKNRGINYLALGHLHSYYMGMLDDEGVYCYSGCPAGRGFDECGTKGFVLLDIEDGRIKSEFVPNEGRVFHEVKVDISGLEGITQYFNAIQSQIENICEDDLVKLVLTGSFPVDAGKDVDYLLKKLENVFYFIKIKDESTVKIDAEDYRYDKSLKGEFVRLVMSSDMPEEEKKTIILSGLTALRGEEPAL